jgi:hypothetical protein
VALVGMVRPTLVLDSQSTLAARNLLSLPAGNGLLIRWWAGMVTAVSTCGLLDTGQWIKTGVYLKG